MIPDLTIDLRLSPTQRWHLSAEQRAQARDLLDIYSRDAGLNNEAIALVAQTIRPFLAADHLQEIEGLAQQLEVPTEAVIVGNAYYDLVKTALACSAFAIDAPGGPLHARNLDWWTQNDLLSTSTLVSCFTGAPAGDFISIGWPGFAGMLSGLAPGRFAVTLNAVLSDEPQQLAMPVGLLMRQVFEEARNFDEAVERLSTAPLSCDCLLLVSGVRPGQMLVIERTPTRHAIRRAENGFVHVTNDYRLIDPDTSDSLSELQTTSCGRFERLADRLSSGPDSPDACLELLSDPGVIMSITVQQMVFQAATGTFSWRSV